VDDVPLEAWTHHCGGSVLVEQEQGAEVTA